VSIAGSRAAGNWELKVEGPNGFERSLSAAAGEHEPATIRTVVLRLVPSAKAWPRLSSVFSLARVQYSFLFARM
jgi:hypothetical protein